MARKISRLQKVADRATLLDGLHLAAIVACSVWTATLIVEERFGSLQSAAGHVIHSLHAGHDRMIVTIRLDDAGLTAAP